jgi:hypothetical protein
MNQTYREILGEEQIREIVHAELSQAETPPGNNGRVNRELESWAVNRIEALAPQTVETAATELRSGFSAFARGLTEYVNQRGEQATDVELAERFLATAKRCGMVPCSKECCEFCRSCKTTGTP